MALGIGDNVCQVTLHIYEPLETDFDAYLLKYKLPKFVQKAIAKAGRIYLSAIEVHERELVYDDEIGIHSKRPLIPPEGFRFKESRNIGFTSKTKKEVDDVLAKMKSDFNVGSYDLLVNNSNDFTSALCDVLGVSRPPAFVNRAAKLGKDALPEEERKNMIHAPQANLTNISFQEEGGGISTAPVELKELINFERSTVINAKFCSSHIRQLSTVIVTSEEMVVLLKKQKKKAKIDDRMESDCDAQMLIFLLFNKKIALKQLRLINTNVSSIKLFVNVPSMDFEDANDRRPAMCATRGNNSDGDGDGDGDGDRDNEFLISPSPPSTFKNIETLYIFIEKNTTNDNDEPSFVHYIQLLGTF